MKTLSTVLISIGVLFLLIGLALLLFDNVGGIRFYIVTSVFLNTAGLILRGFVENDEK